MKALKINNSDSTCFEATMSRGFSPQETDEEFVAAVPDCWAHADQVTHVYTKGGGSYINLRFPNATNIAIKSFTDSSEEAAIKGAVGEAIYSGIEIERNTDWWKDIS